MRGVLFDHIGVTYLPKPQHRKIAANALLDVARWLGYRTAGAYNIATIDAPREVRRRLREAV